MDAARQHQQPQQREADHEGPQAAHPELAQRRHAAGQRQRAAERDDIEVGGVEQGDDQHRADVVDDGDGDQQQLDRGGRMAAEDRQHADREGDVGRGRDRPAAGRAPDRRRRRAR